MSGFAKKEKNKVIQEKCQMMLADLLKDEDNKYCVDCDGKSPRWASWNIGIFLCIRCAGIHRNLGVHISKVKSVNLDTWTPQQVACMEQMGNSKARAVYEANLPDNFRRPQTDSSLEQFVRAKYEQKKYIAREWVEPPMPIPTWDIALEKQLSKKKEKKVSNAKSEGISKSSKISIPNPLPKLKSPEKSENVKNSTENISSETQEVSKKEEKNSNLQDLLGLDEKPSTDSNADPFGDFLSASAKESKPTSNTSADLLKEANLFSQNTETSSEKLSKDSILALYGQIPRQPISNEAGNAFAVNGMPVYQNPQGQLNTTFNNGMIPGSTPNYQNYTYGRMPDPNMVAMMHTGITLSSANPFAQMQHQMPNLSMTGNMQSHQQNLGISNNYFMQNNQALYPMANNSNQGKKPEAYLWQ